MNIALFTDTYLPDINGVASSTHILYNELKKYHHVLVVTTTLPHDSDYEDEDQNILRLPGLDLKKMYGYRASAIYSIKGMKELKEFAPDIIHIQTEFGIGIFGRIAGEILNVPVCYTYHTMWADYSHYIVPEGFKSIDYAAKKIIEKISKVYGDTCGALIVPSVKTAQALKSYGISNEINVVPTGLELDRFIKKDQQLVNEIIEQYRLQDKFVVTFVGRVAQEKSIDMLLYAFRKIKNVNENIALLVVGGGPQLEELQQLAIDLDIDDVVIFTDAKENDMIPSFYHASSLFVSASLSETQGLTYIEAMASGIPVLARFDSNLEDVIENEKNGYFFESEDELVECILTLSKQDLSLVSQNALNSSKKYSSHSFYENIMSVYQKALSKHHYCYQVKSITQDDKNYIVSFQFDRHEVQIRLSQAVINRYELYAGRQIDREQLEALKDHEQSVIAYNQALKYLTYKDYTYMMMKQKLTSNYDFSDIQIGMAMESLIQKGLIDDYQYTKDYFEKSKRLNIGIHKIVNNLKKDGVSPFVIDECLEEYSSDIEYDKAITIITKLYNENTTRSPNALIQNIRNKLFNKGFSSSTVEQAMNDFTFEFGLEHLKMLLTKEYNKVYRRYSRKYEGKELKQKIKYFLLQKGYEYGDVSNIIDELWEENE